MSGEGLNVVWVGRDHGAAGFGDGDDECVDGGSSPGVGSELTGSSSGPFGDC